MKVVGICGMWIRSEFVLHHSEGLQKLEGVSVCFPEVLRHFFVFHDGANEGVEFGFLQCDGVVLESECVALTSSRVVTFCMLVDFSNFSMVSCTCELSGSTCLANLRFDMT